MDLSDPAVAEELYLVLNEFGDRHVRVENYLIARFEEIKTLLTTDTEQLSHERKLLIGSYFTHEYALEAAALFNPSIVWHPEQPEGLDGSRRFVLSLRATGEGHISSVVFRTGSLDSQANVRLDEYSRFVTPPEVVEEVTLHKRPFFKRLVMLRLDEPFMQQLENDLPEVFTYEELYQLTKRHPFYSSHRVITEAMLALGKANYEIAYTDDHAMSERILFPYSPNEMNGIEDARFVQFTDDDGSITYYATYTAYNGRVIFPQLVETTDFRRFKVCMLEGKEAQNKGMALFPRKIKGKYRMLGRQDGENIFIMESDDLHVWREKTLLVAPEHPWEFVQLGNCGSPIETDAGWLVLSHGVGAMRKYCIGALLLDKDDPTKVLGDLPYPLLRPEGDEREGYVPNVVYTCGAIIHAGYLVIPYAMSDYMTGFAKVKIDTLLEELLATY
jgi:predicted GH43/DUF377 family glycosyl hydrolase